MLTVTHIISLAMTLSFIVLLGWISISRVKNSSDFMVGGHQASSWTVAGMLVGTLIGGVSTIGASQLGYLYGMSAFWFTLSLGIATFILGLLAKALKRKPFNTISEVLETAYGRKIISLASFFLIFGMIINVASNLLAARSLLIAITPFSPAQVTVAAGIIMMIYIIFGGIWSGSWIGLFKTALIYSLIAMAVGTVIQLKGGFAEVAEMVRAGGGLNIFARGTGKELAGGISVFIGVLSTQTYLQAMFAGKDARTSRKGAWLAAAMILPVGLMGFFVGLYMRFQHPGMDSAQVLPVFILQYLPPWFGGIAFGGLLLSVIGGGAGLVLGISTVISNDIYLRLIRPRATEREKLWVNRGTIVVVVSLVVYYLLGGTSLLMSDLTYLSMGLRGATIFLPLLGALFLRKWVPVWAGYALITVGAGTVVLWFLLGDKAVDPVYPALAADLVLLMVALWTEQWRKRRSS